MSLLRVTLNKKLERPDFYIVPSKVVANETKTGHKKWLNEKSKNGTAHKDNSMRTFKPDKKSHSDKWSLLF